MLSPQRRYDRDTRCAAIPARRASSLVRDFDELEGIAVRIFEVHPPPAGEYALVDDVDLTVELDPCRLECCLLRLDVLDEEGDVGGSEAAQPGWTVRRPASRAAALWRSS